ncbi:MAG TPA: bifunctional diguanylate cyclase/phosphodiesterase, partial [Thiomicrospira sp.]|nr:bifunctional diguanylate cyclase/phosphodiesterase [Thiomicrospira sp.]
VLIAVSKRLQNLIRKTDILSRFGGDEFVFVLDHLSEKSELEVFAKKFLNSVRQPFNINGTIHSVSMSLGLSIYPKDGLTAMDLIENADTAMYEAKRSGKNQHAYYNSDIRLQQIKRYEMQQDLERAVEQSQFVVFYQPQIDHKSKAIVGLEALVRWQHPDKGLINPDDFIPLAEEFKLIIPIGEQVLRQACLDIKQLHDDALFTGYMSVNVSGIQIDSDLFLQTVNKILDETQVTPTLLEMEITESVVMTNPEKWIALFKNLKSIGLKIAIDDFGKGYSSLSHLSDLPLDKLKIDMSFVKRLPHDKKARAIAQSIIDLSENMGMVSLAEGIEKQEQQDFLEQQNCEIGQGFLFAKPMPFEALKTWLVEYEATIEQATA